MPVAVQDWGHGPDSVARGSSAVAVLGQCVDMVLMGILPGLLMLLRVLLIWLKLLLAGILLVG